jgi:VWFA-related protein
MPLSIALVIEKSARIDALLPLIRRTGVLLTHSVIGEAGEAAVFAYSDHVDQVLEFTQDHDLIERALEDLQSDYAEARLYDALGAAVHSLRSRPRFRRRVIIALCEAIDAGSKQKLSSVVKEAQVNDITIYSVGLSTLLAEIRGPQKHVAPLSVVPPGTQDLPPLPGIPDTPTVRGLRAGSADVGALFRHAWSAVSSQPSLAVAVAATGGLHQSTFQQGSIEQAIDRIGDELHSPYILSYLPTKTLKKGFRQIKVAVIGQPNIFKVRARPGYYAGLP